jgi:membrane protein DedA with SNARE-associated domain
MASGFLDPLLRLLMSPLGVGVLAALDSTLVFWLPLGVDLAMVILGARHPDFFWIYPIVGTAGSLLGAATSFRMGQVAGEAGLKHFIPERRLARVRRRVSRGGAVTLAGLDLLPPPFPFTLFLLAAGALDVDRTRFFVTLGVVRLLRFGIESGLGALYGDRLAVQIGSRLVRDVAGLCILAAGIASVFSLVRLLRKRPNRRRTR